MTVDLALDISTMRNVDLWDICRNPTAKPGWTPDVLRAEALDVLAEEVSRLRREAIPEFVARVNARAEADMLNGNPITGAHHRALEVELTAAKAALEGK